MSKSSRQVLLGAVRAALHSINTKLNGRMMKATADCLYEVFTLGLVCSALDKKGAALEARNGVGRTGTLLLRRKPGRVCGDVNFGFIHVTYAHRQFELHTDVMVEAYSATAHEIDVAMLEARECDRARKEKRDPLHTKLRLVFECKHYVGPLPLRIGREFVGLLQDMRFKEGSALISTGPTESIDAVVADAKGRVFAGLAPKRKTPLVAFAQWINAALGIALK